MLSLVTRHKQKHEAKGPNLVEGKASKLIESFDFVLSETSSSAEHPHSLHNALRSDFHPRSGGTIHGMSWIRKRLYVVGHWVSRGTHT